MEDELILVEGEKNIGISCKTFKEIDKEKDIEKEIKKTGLSLGIIFSRDDIKRFNLKYGDIIKLNNAEIIEKIIDENKQIEKVNS